MRFRAIAVREMLGQRNGTEKFSVGVRIGEPYRVNDVSWACPVAVEGVDEKLADMHGIDSWQALMLAIIFFEAEIRRERQQRTIARDGPTG